MKVPCTKGYWKKQSREAHQGVRGNTKEVRRRWEKGVRKIPPCSKWAAASPHPLAVLPENVNPGFPNLKDENFWSFLLGFYYIPQNVANILARPKPLLFHVMVQPWDSSAGKGWLWEKHAWISGHTVCSPCLPLWPLLTRKKSLII